MGFVFSFLLGTHCRAQESCRADPSPLNALPRSPKLESPGLDIWDGQLHCTMEIQDRFSFAHLLFVSSIQINFCIASMLICQGFHCFAFCVPFPVRGVLL